MNRKATYRSKLMLGSALLCILALPAVSVAVEVDVDEIIAESGDGADLSVLSGTVVMDLVSNGEGGFNLVITLTNTSSGITGGDDSTNLLSGIGFVLPGEVEILGGQVDAAGPNLVNFPEPKGKKAEEEDEGVDLDEEWGFGDGGGGFNDLPSSEVNTTVSTLQASVDQDFTESDKPKVAGPGFGLLSGNVSLNPEFGQGQPAIQNSLTVTLFLGGSVPTDLIQQINLGHVVLSFGSPNTLVPEPGTLLLLGSGLLGLGILGNRKKKGKQA